MAAKTPDSIRRDNVGGSNVIVATFSTTTLADTDTWTQSVPGYVAHSFTQTNNPSTQAAAGVSVGYSSGVFTFYPGEDAATGILRIYIKA